MTTHIWHFRKNLDRRFRQGHPWVYSNEILESPKGIDPGALIELRDPSGGFLARGYGNSHSLIAFRELTRDPELKAPDSVEAITQKLRQAITLRIRAGLGASSFRACFGEADQLPGLVVDRYKTESGQVLVIQAHTAGIDVRIPTIIEALETIINENLLQVPWIQTAIVLRNDMGVRKLEGLTEQEPQVFRESGFTNLAETRIVVGDQFFWTDLIAGQKTGFFLDQASNIKKGMELFGRSFAEGFSLGKRSLRILDLCCYVGQWGSSLARNLVKQGVTVEVTVVDASQRALDFTARNLDKINFKAVKADVLKDLASWPKQEFDLIVCDPPALIKSRKDLPAGTHAYLKLNSEVFRLIRRGGGVVSCSCSGLLSESDFVATLAKASQRQDASVSWIGRGSQSPDHPVLSSFMEGSYLKAWFGISH
ncbi:class I SAM-dependent rRNA methyltransferase [Bdellovibrionota bacterium FG-2]